MKVNTGTVLVGGALVVAAFLAWQWARNQRAPVATVQDALKGQTIADLPTITQADPAATTTADPPKRPPSFPSPRTRPSVTGARR